MYLKSWKQDDFLWFQHCHSYLTKGTHHFHEAGMIHSRVKKAFKSLRWWSLARDWLDKVKFVPVLNGHTGMTFPITCSQMWWITIPIPILSHPIFAIWQPRMTAPQLDGWPADSLEQNVWGLKNHFRNFAKPSLSSSDEVTSFTLISHKMTLDGSNFHKWPRMNGIGSMSPNPYGSSPEHGYCWKLLDPHSQWKGVFEVHQQPALKRFLSTTLQQWTLLNWICG